ncbi:dihydroxy-acid dehydratase, partial [Aliarcobacter butzleri]|uniref:dihydroxy-acid dehydratase domain-containing protein n=1 Tax=Aliarcobacter butzleri TaxID=28197 RepID=UPI003AE686BE
VSHIAKISPSLSTVHMGDINKAGGVNAVMKEMTQRGNEILADHLTISGETVLEKIKDAYIKDTNIIHTIDNPYSQVGG